MSYHRDILHNAAAATADGAILDVKDAITAMVHLVNTGSPVGTITFEGTVDAAEAAGTWIAVAMEKSDGTLATSTTAAGYFRLPLNHGLSKFRARISAYTSGTFLVLSGVPRRTFM